MSNRYWLVSSLSLTGGDNPLTWNPHPTRFAPYSQTKTAGTGDLRGLGYAQFVWQSGEGILTAEQWYYLMSFFSGDEPSVDVYVRTRTDRAVVNALGDYEFEYRWYYAKMHRPTAEPYPAFRFRNVEIIFTNATEV